MVSAEAVVFDGEVRSVRFPGVDGSYGILPNHAPLMTATVPGVLEITHAEGERESMVVMDGFAEMRGNVLTVAAEAGDRARDIDLEAARAAEKHARDLLANKAALAEEDVLRAEESLRRALLHQLVGQRSGGSLDL